MAGVIAAHAVRLAGSKMGVSTLQSLMSLRSFDDRCAATQAARRTIRHGSCELASWTRWSRSCRPCTINAWLPVNLMRWAHDWHCNKQCTGLCVACLYYLGRAQKSYSWSHTAGWCIRLRQHQHVDICCEACPPGLTWPGGGRVQLKGEHHYSHMLRGAELGSQCVRHCGEFCVQMCRLD